MMKNIYVGNLPYSATEDQVRSLFAQYGEVTSVKIVKDPVSGSSKGFAFVEMATGGNEAIEKVDNCDMGGRSLRVKEALPRQAREPRGNGGGRGDYNKGGNGGGFGGGRPMRRSHNRF
jgi:cold-inducible RNA-binding protein